MELFPVWFEEEATEGGAVLLARQSGRRGEHEICDLREPRQYSISECSCTLADPNGTAKANLVGRSSTKSSIPERRCEPLSEPRQPDSRGQREQEQRQEEAGQPAEAGEPERAAPAGRAVRALHWEINQFESGGLSKHIRMWSYRARPWSPA